MYYILRSIPYFYATHCQLLRYEIFFSWFQIGEYLEFHLIESTMIAEESEIISNLEFLFVAGFLANEVNLPNVEGSSIAYNCANIFRFGYVVN